ncbi:MAG: AI-2E family transporter [Candidatus Woesearchaeota archaeon]|nr:AI-2E family transporter [Candidatus Woesearchaeota archaeon]
MIKISREKERFYTYAFLAIFAAVIVLSFLLIRPFITVILASAVVSYMLYPLFRALNKKIGSKNISAAVVIIAAVIVVGSLSVFIFSELYKEIKGINISDNLNIGMMEKRACIENDILCKSINYFIDIVKSEETKETISALLSNFSKSFLFSIPSLFLNMIIFIFLLFYFLRDGDKIIAYIKGLLPLKESLKNDIERYARDVIHSTIYGAIIIALMQGFVGAVAFILFDSTDAPIMWGMITAVAALVPFIGTAAVWLPMSLMQIIKGHLYNSNIILWKGIGLLIFGAVVISSIDNILKPRIIGKEAKINPVLVLLGAVGGIRLMGPMGVFIGPFVFALFASFAKVYAQDTYKCKKM